jgi:hypothetical protein
MGYGLGIALLVIGLVLALAVNASVSGIDIQTLGWILVLGGVVVLVLTAVQLNLRRRTTSARVTTHADGTQSASERRVVSDPPPPTHRSRVVLIAPKALGRGNRGPSAPELRTSWPPRRAPPVLAHISSHSRRIAPTDPIGTGSTPRVRAGNLKALLPPRR